MKRILACFRVFGFSLILALSLSVALQPLAQAADFTIFGGSGGGGGGVGPSVHLIETGGGSGGAASLNGGGGGDGQRGGGGGGGYYLYDGGVIGVGTNGATASSRTGGLGIDGGGSGGNADGSPGSPGTAGGGGGGAFHSSPAGLSIGGAGGSGSISTHTMLFTSYGDVIIAGGHGGNGGNLQMGAEAGGGGGGGGSVDVSAAAGLTVNSLSMSGGNGGKGGNGSTMASTGPGGTGGVAGGGGGGGNGDNNSQNISGGGGGGGGGNAALTVTDTLNVNGVLSLTSGQRGANGVEPGPGGGGAGGGVSLTATTLIAPTINLTKNDGALSFNVTNLQIDSVDTTLIALGLGMGDATISNLLLTGTGNFSLFEDGSQNDVHIGQLHINGGTLNSTNWNNLVDNLGGIVGKTYAVTQDITLETGGATVDLGLAEDKTLTRNLIGAGSLTKNGAGTLTLSGANNYSGGTNLSQGRIDVGNNTALGIGALSMNDGTTLGFTGNYSVGNTISLNGLGSFDTSTHDATLSGIISGAGSLTKTGAGTLTLSGANTYSGLTTLLDGTLAIGDVGGNWNISDKMDIYGGATLDASLVTMNAGDLTKLDVRGPANWTGNLNMAGQSMNFYLPTTMGDGGTMLSVSGNANIAGSQVNVGIDGATLANGNRYTLITAATLNTSAGAFPVNGTVGGFPYTVSVVGNALVLNIGARASAHSIPTLGHWALLLLIALLGIGVAFHPSVRNQMARNK